MDATSPAHATPAASDIAKICTRPFQAARRTLLIDQYLTNTPAASARIFRVYKPTPPHYHFPV